MLDYKASITKHYVLHLSAREISRQIGISKSGVLKFLHAFENSKDIDFPLPPDITNMGIALKVYGKISGAGIRNQSFEYPDYLQGCDLMKKRQNMTLQECWQRYTKRCLREGTKPYLYRQFCKNFEKWSEENCLHYRKRGGSRSPEQWLT